MKNSFKFFNNKDCEYFPCHKVSNNDEFNCLFCYCPLYLKKECVGNPKYLENGIKDCSGCLVPHQPQNYDLIIKAFYTRED